MNWAQLRTILWLRWRLARNQFLRGGIFAAIVFVGLAALAAQAAAGAFIGGIYGGWLFLAKQPSSFLLLAWDVVVGTFLFFWTIGLLIEVQRSETIDIARLLHLPVSLGQVFVMNYLASHFSLTLIVWVPAMVGLALGLAAGRGPTMLLLLPLVAATVFMVTAWTYCLRGWLVALMINKRRRRAIVVLLSLAFLMISQLPNLYFNVFRSRTLPRPPPSAGNAQAPAESRSSRERLKEMLGGRYATVHRYVPVLWLPLAAQELAEHRAWPALLGTAGGLILGGLGLRRAYRSALRFYVGAPGRSRKAVAPRSGEPVAEAERAAAPSRFLELRLPGVPEQATAVALASFRSMSRAPEVKMGLAVPILMTITFSAVLLVRHPEAVAALAKPFIATAAACGAWLYLFQFTANQFGHDRDAFRSLILMPVDRKYILLGKNIAVLAVGFAVGSILLGACSVAFRLPLTAVAAAMLQLLGLLPLVGLMANLSSILAPYRLQSGSLRATKLPVRALVATFLGLFLLPLMLAPAFVPPVAELIWTQFQGARPVPVNLLLSALFAGSAALVYWKTLNALGRLLRAREIEILRAVTSEVE